jgi:hypothetical protein
VKLSDDFGSKKTLGWLVPRSMAGQPSSVNQIGFDCGTHAVGVLLSTPPGRLHHHRPHSALGNVPPAEFAMKSTLEKQAA